MANPKMWIYEQVRLSELLERRPLTDVPQVRRIYDEAGVLVAESTAELSAPDITRGHPVFDAGVEVGRIEIIQSLRPLVNHTAVLELVALAAGVLLFLAIRLVPLRVIEESERAMAESERRYRALYETMREGVAVFTIDPAGGGSPARISLIDANPSWKTMCGGEIGMDGAQLLGGELGTPPPRHSARGAEQSGANL